MQPRGRAGTRDRRPLWRTAQWLATELTLSLPCDPTPTLLGTHTKALRPYVHTRTCKRTSEQLCSQGPDLGSSQDLLQCVKDEQVCDPQTVSFGPEGVSSRDRKVHGWMFNTCYNVKEVSLHSGRPYSRTPGLGRSGKGHTTEAAERPVMPGAGWGGATVEPRGLLGTENTQYDATTSNVPVLPSSGPAGYTTHAESRPTGKLRETTKGRTGSSAAAGAGDGRPGGPRVGSGPPCSGWSLTV